MRNIKFRAWDNTNKEILDVQELNYQDSYDGQPMIRTTMYNDYFDIEDMTLMQYTGLKDKNGNEIYEGDIIKFHYIKNGLAENTGTVAYHEDYAQYIVKDTNYAVDDNEPLSDYEDLQVIGNIYENKDLLEEKR